MYQILLQVGNLPPMPSYHSPLTWITTIATNVLLCPIHPPTAARVGTLRCRSDHLTAPQTFTGLPQTHKEVSNEGI